MNEFNPTTRLTPVEKRRGSIFHSSTDPIFILAGDSRILDANPAALNAIGLSLADGRGHVWAECLSPASRFVLIESLRRVLSEKIILQALEVEIPAADRSTRYYEIDLIPMDDPEYPNAVLVFAHDQTARSQRERELRESQTFYRALIEDTPDIVFQLDAQGLISYVSPNVEQVGLSPADLHEKNLLSFLQSAEIQPIRAAVSRSLAGASESFETLYSPDGKEQRRVHITLRPVVEQNRQVGVRGVLSDLEPYREIDQILERRAAQLATLNQIGREITSALDLDEVLQNAVNLLHASFGYYHVAVFTLDENNGDAVMRGCAGSFAQRFASGHRLRAGQGMVGWVFENHRTLLANDVTHDGSYVNLYPNRFPSLSELTVPILIRDKLAGVLDLQSPQINAFAADDVRVIETVASQLAVAMANALLFAQTQQRLREKQQAEDLLRLQRDMLAAVGQALNFQDALTQILAILSSSQIFDSGSIYLVESNGGMRAVAHVGLTPEFATAVDFLPAEANKTRFIKLGKPGYMRYADLELDQRIPSSVRQHEAMLCLAMLPILRLGEVIACLTLGSHSSPDISSPVRLVLEAVSEQLGAVISRLKVERILSVNKGRDQALLDALPDFMFIVDRQGRFLAVKPAIDAGFINPAETYLGRHVGEVMPPNAATQILTMLHRTLETRQVQEFEYQVVSEPGRSEFFEARMSAASDDQAVTIVRNITRRRQFEQDLEKHIHDLEAENLRLRG